MSDWARRHPATCFTAAGVWGIGWAVVSGFVPDGTSSAICVVLAVAPMYGVLLGVAGKALWCAIRDEWRRD